MWFVVIVICGNIVVIVIDWYFYDVFVSGWCIFYMKKSVDMLLEFGMVIEDFFSGFVGVVVGW